MICILDDIILLLTVEKPKPVAEEMKFKRSKWETVDEKELEAQGGLD